MTDALTALEAAREFVQYKADIELYPRWPKEVLGKLDTALQSLSEPFDPAKHLGGWVKRKPLNHLTTTQVYTFNGWHLVYDMLGGKLPYTLRKHDFLIRLAIPTASFFHALCEALNIK